MKLLNIDANPKTVKGQKRGYMTAVLYLAPYKLSGFQVCPMAEIAGCAEDCLNTAGRGGMARKDAETLTIDGAHGGHTIKLNAIQKARIARTRLLVNEDEAFMEKLINEIRAAQRKAKRKGLKLVVRLNGTSDIRWENLEWYRKTIFEWFKDVQFYDYTKIPNRNVRHIPNYYLTFSGSARAEYAKILERAIAHYGAQTNIAFSFQGKAPATFMGRDVIDGDESDLRFLDRTGVVVALKAKGRARTSRSGFSVAA